MAITSGCISPESGATFVVGAEGVVDFQAGDTGIRPIDSSSTLPTLINNGTIVKTAGVGTFESSTIGYQDSFNSGDKRLILQNNGTIRAAVGTVRIYVSEGSTTGGLFDMTDGNFTFQRGEDNPSSALAITGTVQGDGTVQVSDELSFAGTLDLGGTLVTRDGQILEETLTINQLNELRVNTSDFTDAVFAFNTAGSHTVQILDVQGRMELNTDLTIADTSTFGVNDNATLTGTGNLTVPAGASMEWGDGSMGEGGTLTIEGTLTSVVAKYTEGDFPVQRSQAILNGRDVVVSGSVVWDDAPLYLNAGATVDVQAGGTVDIQRDGRIEPGDGSTSEEQFVNAGTVVKTGIGQRTSSGDEPVAYDDKSSGSPIGVPFLNSGTLSLEAGRTGFTDALDNTGLIQGTDTLDVSTVGAFTNTGTVGPGTSPGLLTVEGAADLSGTTLAIEALGPTPGTEHDQLHATGDVQLGGTLDVTLLDGYDPPGGTSFTIVEAASVAGTFDAENLPPLSGGKTMSVAYESDRVLLDVEGAAGTTGTLAGTVFDNADETPIAGATVGITALDRSTTTDSEGAYTLDDLEEGTYTVEANADGYAAAMREVTITAGETTNAFIGLDAETSSNAPPTAADDAVATFRNVPVVIDVLANDSDDDGDALTITSVGEPTLGSVAIVDAGLQYTPNDGATGTDTFPYTVSDGNGGTDEATVTVTITAFGFTVTDVGTLGGAVSRAVAVDGAGRVVGVSTTESGAARAFAWEDGVIQPLPSPEADAIQLTAINESGDVVGAAQRDSTSEAFLIPADGPSTALGTLGGPFSAAYAINQSGTVVGTAATSNQTHHAFQWDGTMTDLGTFGAAHSEAFGINDTGTIVGIAVGEEGATRPFVGDAVLDGAASGRAYAINESEQVAGSRLDGDRVVAQSWTADGTGKPLPGLGGNFAEAYALNNAGWVVGTAAVGADASTTAAKAEGASARLRQWRAEPGASWRRGATVGAASSAKLAGDDGSYHAVLWVDGTAYDLNDFILDPGNAWTLIEARYVTDDGQIVGYGRYQGDLRAFVLTPADNAPPQVRSDAHRVTTRTPTVLDVLANDTDHDGQPLRIVQVLDRPSGTVRLTPDSTAITYTPALGFRGSDRFRYRVSDGAGGTAQTTVRVEVAVASPTQFRLHPNYPNPFRGQTTIRYELPEAVPAHLALYDMLGRRVITLVDGEQPSGVHEITMEPDGLASGVYLLRLQAGDAVTTRRLTIVR